MKNNINDYTIYLPEDIRISAWQMGAPIDVTLGTSGIENIKPVTAEQLLGWLRDKLDYIKVDIREIKKNSYTYVIFLNDDVFNGMEYEGYETTLIEALKRIMLKMEKQYKNDCI